MRSATTTVEGTGGHGEHSGVLPSQQTRYAQNEQLLEAIDVVGSAGDVEGGLRGNHDGTRRFDRRRTLSHVSATEVTPELGVYEEYYAAVQ